MRNLGVPIAHCIISYKAILKGLDKLTVNQNIIVSELNNNWIIISEAIQTILRREGVEKPYEKLKELTRHNTIINKEDILHFIESLDISNKVKLELKNISPENYTGKS